MRIVDRRQLPIRNWLSEVVPDWLTEVVRPKSVPVPWPDMAPAVLAIWAPLAAGLITGHRALGLLPAFGGLLGVMIDNGGPYLARARRISCAAVFGGAAGLPRLQAMERRLCPRPQARQDRPRGKGMVAAVAARPYRVHGN